MGRLARGWALTKESWRVMRAEPSLIAFAVVGSACAVLAGGASFAVGAGVGVAIGSEVVALPWIAAGFYLMVLIGLFFAVALIACADASFDGRDASFRHGLQAAWERRDAIVAWSGVQFVVGAVVSLLHAVVRDLAGTVAGWIFGSLLNATWSLATFFVLPVIALEGLGPRAALEQSAALVRERWGESVVGSGIVAGAVYVGGFLGSLALVALGMALLATSGTETAGWVAIGAAVVLFAVTMVVVITVGTVYRLVVYRFATQGTASAGYAAEHLERAFVARRRWRRGRRR